MLTYISEHGYITGYSEDSIEYGPFHYRLRGYTNQPTDLYSRPFFERAKRFNKGRPNLCLNNKTVARYQFDYIRNVFKTLPNQLKFFFSFNGKSFFITISETNNQLQSQWPSFPLTDLKISEL